MRAALRRLRRLGAREDGVAAVEFCLTLPILLMMTAGAYDVSRLIATRIDYQQAVTEGAGLAIAQPPQKDFTYLVNAVAAAAQVPTSQVAVSKRLRCNDVLMPVGSTTCASMSDERAWYVNIAVRGSYTPVWKHFEIDQPVTLNITRTVRVQ